MEQIPRRATTEVEDRIERGKRKVARFIPVPKRKRNDAGDAVQEGIDQRRAGKYDDALMILGSHVADNPHDSRALTELGKVYDLRGDHDTAYSYYQNAATADTRNREAIERDECDLIGIMVAIDTDAPASKPVHRSKKK